MIDYDFPLWRPPSEGDNLIIQATLGCRFNHCSFCSMYKAKTYQVRPQAEVFTDIDRAARQWPDAHRVFLADGDAYGLPTDTLLGLAARLAEKFRALQRITAYATPFNINAKSVEEIQALRKARLGLVYLGVESGSDRMLRTIGKGKAQNMVAALGHAREAGLKVSATVILGLGGKRHWQEHIEETAAMINQQPPSFLSILQLRLAPEVEENFLSRFDEPFEWQDDLGMVEEQRRLIELLAPPSPVIFRSNHASNALPLAGTLPKDKARLLTEIATAEQGDRALRPRWLRGL